MSVRDQDVKDVQSALELLRQARDLLKAAGARQTVKRVRLAITSCGGALRHAKSCTSGVYEGGFGTQAGAKPE